MQLTIAIPTYNRNENVNDTLRALLPQLTPDCTLVIIDNCSLVPVADTAAAVLSQYPDVLCRIIRNAVNIGVNANIVRCFEVCETEWIWVLGDDDILRPDAVQTILTHIAGHPESLFFSFYAPYPQIPPRRETVFTHGVEEFARRMGGYGNVLFISSGVYRAPSLRRQVSIGYYFGYSSAPHVAMLLMSLGDTGSCCISDRIIVECGDLAPEETRVAFAHLMGMGTILDLPIPSRARAALRSQMMTEVSNGWITPKAVCFTLLLLARHYADADMARYLYDQLAHRFLLLNTKPTARLKVRLFGWLLCFQRVSYPLARLGYRLTKGRGAEWHVSASDRRWFTGRADTDA